eukprot:3940826-Rhodomonas_salina.2
MSGTNRAYSTIVLRAREGISSTDVARGGIAFLAAHVKSNIQYRQLLQSCCGTNCVWCYQKPTQRLHSRGNR